MVVFRHNYDSYDLLAVEISARPQAPNCETPNTSESKVAPKSLNPEAQTGDEVD